MSRIFILAGALVFASLTLSARSEGLVDRWIAAQTNFHTWSAEMVQTRSFKTLSQPLISKGRVWVAIPDRFRWELGQPAETIALRQPGELTIVYPRLKRAEKYSLQAGQSGPWRDALALLDASFPSSRTNLESHFQILSLTETNSIASLALQPRSSAARKFLGRLLISFRTDDFSPVATELTFSDGSGMRNDFNHSQFNQPIDPGVFTMKLDATYTVAEPAKQ